MCFGEDLAWRTVEEARRRSIFSIFTGSVRVDDRGVVEVTAVPLTVVAVIGLGALDESFSGLGWMADYSVRELRAEWDRYEGSWSRVWLQRRESPCGWEALTEEQVGQLWQLLTLRRIGLLAHLPQRFKWL